jgi:hypothetical protein
MPHHDDYQAPVAGWLVLAHVLARLGPLSTTGVCELSAGLTDGRVGRHLGTTLRLLQRMEAEGIVSSTQPDLPTRSTRVWTLTEAGADFYGTARDQALASLDLSLPQPRKRHRR